MIYILAGNECTGKTTLFDMLKKGAEFRPETTFIKESYTDADGAKSIRMLYFLQTLLENNKTVVYDRATILDDMVYSKVIDGRRPLHYDDCRKILCGKRYTGRYKVIYLDTDVEILKKRLAERGDEYIEPEQLVEIKESYEKVLGMLPSASVIRINASGDYYDTYNKVLAAIKWR